MTSNQSEPTATEVAARATGAALDPDRLVSPAALAERWQCTRQHVYSLMDQGLPTLKLGRSRRIRVRDADAWLAEHQSNAEGAA